MKLSSGRSIAIVNLLIFCTIFTILSGAILALLSSHTRQLENSIRRTKSFYVSEAGNVARYDYYRRNVAVFPVPNVEWTFNSAGAPESTKPAAVAVAVGSGIGGTTRIDSTSDYVFNW